MLSLLSLTVNYDIITRFLVLCLLFFFYKCSSSSWQNATLFLCYWEILYWMGLGFCQTICLNQFVVLCGGFFCFVLFLFVCLFGWLVGLLSCFRKRDWARERRGSEGGKRERERERERESQAGSTLSVAQAESHNPGTMTWTQIKSGVLCVFFLTLLTRWIRFVNFQIANQSWTPRQKLIGHCV